MTGTFFNVGAAITPSDDDNYPESIGLGPAQAIYIGTVTGATGAVVVVTPDNVPVTFIGLTAGTVLPVESIRVNSTTTDAEDLVALWQV